MKCPYCAHPEDKVIDSRETREGLATRRRRECLSCKRRFTTYEQVEEIAAMVVKKDNSRERFQRQKLLKGIAIACEKRPVEARAIEAIVDDIEARLSERVDREMQAREIGAAVMERLRELDKVAYVRFASVYKDFQDPEEFVREIQGMLSGAKASSSVPVQTAEGNGAQSSPARGDTLEEGKPSSRRRLERAPKS
jgi:transcriptional repressor NrdR